MTNPMPKISLAVDVTEEQMVEIETKAASGGQFFKPGNYDVKIVRGAFHGVNKTDPTWITIVLDLQHVDGERKIKKFLSVPTKSLKYNKPGIKNPMILTTMLRQFITGLGEDASMESLKTTVSALFQEPSVLEGRVVNVDIGYPGHYVDRVGDGQYKIFERDGKEFRPDGSEPVTYPDRDSAKADAASYNIVVKDFPEITKFIPAEQSDDDTTGW